MRVEIVQDHDDLFSLGVERIGDFRHRMGSILTSTLPGNGNVPPTLERLKEHERVGHTLATVFVILAGRFSGFGWLVF